MSLISTRPIGIAKARPTGFLKILAIVRAGAQQLVTPARTEPVLRPRSDAIRAAAGSRRGAFR
eukprot:5866995-Pleurochrysis_carterae.AAC.5